MNLSIKEVRVRFAPSPTGFLHIGGLRTALYNYLFAKNNNGKFILRIEDTDRNRYVEGSEEYIVKSLEWCGLHPDESPIQGGDYGPYKQSERKGMGIYGKYCNRLVENGHAYYAFDSQEELEQAREISMQNKGTPFQYDAASRNSMKNSLVLDQNKVDQLISSGTAHVVRMKIPENETIIVNDQIRGEVAVNSEELDDKILMKSDGMPTYHLANVVDDHLMEISHVIRGEEWLPSTPLHKLIYRSLGWEASEPHFAHLPLLMKPEGKGKLSKRDSQKYGFPIFPLEWVDPDTGETLSGFKESGFLPDAFINFLAMLGWNPGTEQELFSMEELIKEFSLDRIGKAGARFDIEKAIWFNQQYIKNRPAKVLIDYLETSLNEHKIELSMEKKSAIVEAMRERITFPDDIYSNTKYLYKKPSDYDEKVIRKRWTHDIGRILSDYAQALEKFEMLSEETAKGTLQEVLELNNVGMGKVMPVLRVALTGGAGGPDLMLIIAILGPKECSNRIRIAVKEFNHKFKEV